MSREQAAATDRRTTPVDSPAGSALAHRSGSLIDWLNSGHRAAQPSSAGEVALARLAQLETLEESYDAWRELKLEHAEMRLRYADERDRLEREGSFLLGAVRAAGAGPIAGEAQSSALATADSLHRFVAEAEEKLGRARSALESELAAQEEHFAEAFGHVEAQIRDRISRYAEKVRVQLKLMLRPVGATRTILHVQRVAADEALLLLFTLTGRIPTRYGFLFDDSTDDVMQAPPPLYPDEDVEQVRADAHQLRHLVERAAGPLPIKGFVPLFVARADGSTDFFRLLQRGPVMEVELQEGSDFRSVLTREEGERFAGHLLRLKLAGKIELEIEAG